MRGASDVRARRSIFARQSRYVFVGKTGFGHEHGIVGQLKQGHIDMSPGKNVGILDFDMATFTADTPEARKFVRLEGATDASTQQQVNTNMRGADVLDVGKFPTSRFTIKEIVKLSQPSQSGLPQYRLNGDFTLHGVTRPIQVMAEAEDQRDWTRLRGGFTMLQSQFGITPFTKALGAVGVTDQLTVWGDLWIAKQPVVAAQATGPTAISRSKAISRPRLVCTIAGTPDHTESLCFSASLALRLALRLSSFS